jgi:hypothetical protein
MTSAKFLFFLFLLLLVTAVPPGTELLSGRIESQKWSLETDEDTVCRKRQQGNVFRFEVKKNGKKSWHPLLIAGRLTFETGKTYTFAVKAKADKPDKLHIGIARDEKDYANLGFSAPLPLTTEWQTFTFSFVPKQTSQNGRFDISGFKEGNAYEFLNATLTLKPEEQL